MAEPATLSGLVVGNLQRGLEEEATLTGQLALPAPPLEDWHRLMDRPLIDWGIAPDRFRDEGVDPPSAKAIARAAVLVKDLRCAQMPVLPQVVMSGQGGIIFDWELGDQTLSIEVSEKGELEITLFEGCQVVLRF